MRIRASGREASAGSIPDPDVSWINEPVPRWVRIGIRIGVSHVLWLFAFRTAGNPMAGSGNTSKHDSPYLPPERLTSIFFQSGREAQSGPRRPAVILCKTFTPN